MKKIFSVDTFINLLYLLGNIGFTFFILIPITSLSFIESFCISVIVGYLHTKIEINTLELKNQIFELKEMLKDESRKK